MEFFLPFIVAIITILITPLVLERTGLPRMVSVLIGGIIIGPYGLNIIGWVVELEGGDIDQVMFTFSSLGLIGAIFLMSLAGMEISPKLMMKEWRSIAIFAILSSVIPGITGYAIGTYYGIDWIGALFLASLFASHSVALVFTTLKEFRMIPTRMGVILLKGTLVTDIISLIGLSTSLELAAKNGGVVVANPLYIVNYIEMSMPNWQIVIMSIAVSVAYIFISFRIMRSLSDRVFRKWDARDPRRVTSIFLLLMVISVMGTFIGIHIIVGAFIAGLAIADSYGMMEEERLLHRKFDTIGYGIFIPFFFLYMGLRTNLFSIFNTMNNLSFAIVLLLGIVGTKLLSGAMALKIIGFDIKKSLVGAWVTIPQLSATLVAAAIGHQTSIIPDYVFSSIILVSIITTIARPMGAKYLIEHLDIQLIPHQEIMDYIYSIEEERVAIYEMAEEVPILEPSQADLEMVVEEEVMVEPAELEEEF